MDISKILHFLFELGTSFGLKLLSAIVVLIVGIKVSKGIRKWIRKSPKLGEVDPGVRSFSASFAGIVLNILIFLSVAMILGIPTTSFITALASCGVAIGLALQGALSNFAGGLMILIFKPFKVGDYISTPDASGTVTSISSVYTVLTTPDNKVITVPNGTLTNSVVQNASANDTRRVDVAFNVSYDTDDEKVKNILGGVVKANEKIFSDPEPFIRLTKHGDNALEYTVRVWCNASDYWEIYFYLIERAKKEFDSNGITIPYPQMDVHISGEK